jgi:hypothetical protein
VVIGAWKNKDGPNGHPHYATVQPDPDAKSKELMLANVGESNGFKSVLEGFRSERRDAIRWYYNPHQDFQCTPEIFEKYKTSNYLL